MAGKFSELEAKMSPERRARIAEEVKKALAEMPLNELRMQSLKSNRHQNSLVSLGFYK